MKEIHLGRVLIENRRRRGITQEELANYIGVTTAAISKWETGATYPDILMLPRLAAYFDISIDELMGYEPQLEKEEMLLWYRRLSEEFASLPFEEALAHCREMAKKYYSCYPFLFQIGSLLVNYASLAGSPEKSELVIAEALGLFRRAKEGSTEPSQIRAALQMEAYCLLALKRPAEVLKLLKQDPPVVMPSEPILASAYQMTGNSREAKRVLQIGIYQGLLSLINLLTSYTGLCADDREAFEETNRRLQSLANTFHMNKLHPGILLSCYIALAQSWASFGDTEQALELLEKYTALASGAIYPLRLQGDDYFTLLDDWLKNTLALEEYPPRKESVIRRSITQALTENPAFQNLAEHPRFQAMAERLKRNEEGN